MESSTEHVRRQLNDPAMPLQAWQDEEVEPVDPSDDYAQAELESRKRRIELSIEKALRTT